MAERNTGLPQQKICKKLKRKKIYATYSLKFENLENMKHISLLGWTPRFCPPNLIWKRKKIYATYSLKFENLENMKHTYYFAWLNSLLLSPKPYLTFTK